MKLITMMTAAAIALTAAPAFAKTLTPLEYAEKMANARSS